MVLTVEKRGMSCTVVGDGMVGKTSLVSMFTEKQFPDTYIATVQNHFNGTSWYGGDQYDVNIIDCAGQVNIDLIKYIHVS